MLCASHRQTISGGAMGLALTRKGEGSLLRNATYLRRRQSLAWLAALGLAGGRFPTRSTLPQRRFMGPHLPYRGA